MPTKLRKWMTARAWLSLWSVAMAAPTAYAQAPAASSPTPATNTATDAAQASPTSPQAASVPATIPPATPSTASEGPGESADESEGCFPSCRVGHLCHQGQCISACNPPCPDGQQCNASRQCELVAPPPPVGTAATGAQYPWPPVPPADSDEAPPDAWTPVFPMGGFARYPTFVGYVGFHVGLGGTGTLTPSGISQGISEHFDLQTNGGLEASFEFRLHPYFGLAPGLRLFQARADGASDTSTSLDVLLSPTFHVPLGQVEFLLPLPVGLSFGSAPLDATGGEGGGVTVGITPGLIAWMTEQLGVYAEVGFTWHVRGYTANDLDYEYQFRRTVLTFGLTFAD